MTATQGFAAFAANVQLTDVPAHAKAAGSLHLLDVLGCGLAAHGLGASPYAAAYAGAQAAGPASAIGVSRGIAPAAAALVNGISCHALDFDDTHAASVAHVSSVVAPATLAAAQARGATGADLLLGLLIGNEITCRVGMPVGDAFHRRGFHPTAICGIFGATAAVGRILDLDEDRVVHALGIAGSMASGLLAYLSDGSETKRIHPGWMAHAAHVAVGLAAHGATGPAAVLEGRNGVFQAFLGRDDVAIADAAADLGLEWETPRIAFKPYPACHFIHAGLDAMAEVRAAQGFAVEELDRITMFAPQAGVDMVLAPLERKRRPSTTYEAKFSAPFCIGALLHRGGVDATTFTDALLHDADILGTAAKVDFETREYETFPQSFPAGVYVTLADGRCHEHHLLHQRGGPENPMTDDEVRSKFRANAAVALSAEAVTGLEAAVLGLERLEDLEPLRALQQV